MCQLILTISLNYVQTYVVSGVEKISSGFWWFYTCMGREFFNSLFFVYAAQFLRWGSPLDTEEKKRFQKGGSGLSPANCAQRTAERSACPADSRNRQNPYRDTVENGSTLGNFGIHDPQLDPKALKSTPIF